MQNLSVHAVAHVTVVKTHAQFWERTHIASLGVWMTSCCTWPYRHQWVLGHVNTARRNSFWLLLSCGADPNFSAWHFLGRGGRAQKMRSTLAYKLAITKEKLNEQQKVALLHNNENQHNMLVIVWCAVSPLFTMFIWLQNFQYVFLDGTTSWQRAGNVTISFRTQYCYGSLMHLEAARTERPATPASAAPCCVVSSCPSSSST